MTKRSVFYDSDEKMMEEEEDSDEENPEVEPEVHFLERITVFSVLMDIFRLLYEACSTTFLVESTDKSKPIHLSHAFTTSSLLHLLFSFPPAIPRRIPGRFQILKVIYDPQLYAKLHWANNLHHENVIRLKKHF